VLRRVGRLVVWAALGAVSGLLAGLSSWVFLEALHRVTEWRTVDATWLVWLLPVGGFVVGGAYHRFGGRAQGGTALAVSEAHAYTAGAPARMAPMVLVGTLLGHLVGASVGREGTAVQMSSSLTDAAARRVRLDHDHRAMLARAALAGGFGAVFGVPWAGIVFAFEVARRRTLRAFVAAVPAAFVGDAVVGWLGYHHTARPRLQLGWQWLLLPKLVLAGLVFGLAARVFASGLPRWKARAARWIPWPPARAALGGAATLGLALLLGRQYLGLSLPLVDDAFAGAAVGGWVPWLKLGFTMLALATGFVGGEVTPLFVVGGTLGSVLATPLGLPGVALTSLGFVAVFAGAAHLPLACAVMAGELFGWHAVLPALLVCWCARAVAGRTGIYDHSVSGARAPAPASRAGRGSARRST
jgi:H+/Cl- antiporter ClcA